MPKYLSLDLETTGLRLNDYIIEFACVPIDTKTQEIRHDLSFHRYVKCPSFEDLESQLSPFVLENNEGLIRKAHKEGISLDELKRDLAKYMESVQVQLFFENELPFILGKSLTALDFPLLNKNLGRDDFMRKYFHHRVQDVSSTAMACVDSGLLPEGCTSSRNLAKHFNLGEDVQHTALEDSVDVAKMYFKILDLMKNGKRG